MLSPSVFTGSLARSGLALLLAASFALCTSGTALANGRYPRAQRLKELSSEALLLSGTYGLLLTSNAGKDWYFVCESLLFGRSARGSWIDPQLELLGGTIVSGSPHALRVSSDLGCTFRTETALPVDPTFFSDDAQLNPSGVIVDLTPFAAGAESRLMALVTINDADGRALEHRLYESADATAGWQPVGAAIPASMAHPLFTIDVAPSDPSRIYVSGVAADGFVLLRSTDAGASWQSFPIAIDDEADANGAYIAGVSPADPDRLYVRVPRWTEDEEGAAFWDDSLLSSSDGGETFTDVLRRPGNLLGFALSGDGAVVLAGFGDPNVAPIYTDGAQLGLYRASASDLVFEHVLPEVAIGCITWTETALYLCTNDLDPLDAMPGVSFHVGRTTLDDPRSLDDFTPLLKLKDVRGPTPWADGSASPCAAEWPEADPSSPDVAATCQAFNACEAKAVPPSEGAATCSGSAGSGGNGGGAGASSGGASATGGTGSEVGGSSSGASSVARKPPPASCGCRVAQPRALEPHVLPLLAALALLCRRRGRG